ncbi:sensor histidine kinase [Myroides sp. LJL116]
MFKYLSLKNRIALFITLGFSLMLCVIFAVIYYSVQKGVNKSIFEILENEILSHQDYTLHQDTFVDYIHPREWEEVEHTDVALNPVFIAIYNTDFVLEDHSPNLVQNTLIWDKHQKENVPYLIKLNSIELVAAQAKLYHSAKVVGYIVVAVSIQKNAFALNYLKIVLTIAFPLAILLSFLFARVIAKACTKPISSINSTAKRISKDNLSQRIPLPIYKDELYDTAQTINSLLDRLQAQINRAREFSEDASHELRTPLSIVKGNLEILLLKQRTPTEYIQKINYTLNQVQRLERLVEQFLLLTRVENNSATLRLSTLDLKQEVENSLSRYSLLLQEKHIQVDCFKVDSYHIENYQDLIEVILDNLISNAIKYSTMYGSLVIFSTLLKDGSYQLCFKDNGVGMHPQDLSFVQERFYRGEFYDESDFPGNGIGLSIVSKLCKVVQCSISIESQKSLGTQIFITFKKQLQ